VSEQGAIKQRTESLFAFLVDRLPDGYLLSNEEHQGLFSAAKAMAVSGLAVNDLEVDEQARRHLPYVTWEDAHGPLLPPMGPEEGES